MNPQDYAGVVWKAFYSQKTDGTGFEEIAKVYDVGFDNSSDSVDRNFVDGTSLSIPTNFVPKINMTATKIGAENLKNALPGNVYESGDAIEGMAGWTAGAGGAIKIGPSISTKETVIGTLKLVPQNAAQTVHTILLGNATITANDMNFDDNLAEIPLVATGETLQIGDFTFTSGE